jgi:hypothetical protein
LIFYLKLNNTDRIIRWVSIRDSGRILNRTKHILLRSSLRRGKTPVCCYPPFPLRGESSRKKLSSLLALPLRLRTPCSLSLPFSPRRGKGGQRREGRPKKEGGRKLPSFPLPSGAKQEESPLEGSRKEGGVLRTTMIRRENEGAASQPTSRGATPFRALRLRGWSEALEEQSS